MLFLSKVTVMMVTLDGLVVMKNLLEIQIMVVVQMSFD